MQASSSAYEPKRITQGAGTTVIRDTNSILHNVFFPQTVAGTVAFYNSPTAAGTSDTNLLFTLPNVQGTPLLFNLDYSVKGLVAVTSGTVNFLVSVL